MSENTITGLENDTSVISWQAWSWFLLSIFAGVILATIVLPAWVPNLMASLLAPVPKAFWFLSRGSAFAAFLLLWLSMALGMIITNRLAKLWPGGPVAFNLHEYTSLLGLGFGLFHAMILMGDQYIHYNLFQVLIPFASENYRPLWVGLGQVAFYCWVIVNISFYVRKKIGNTHWRSIHYASFMVFLLVLLHGITSGTDTNAAWVGGIYWTGGGSLLFLLVYRLLAVQASRSKATA